MVYGAGEAIVSVGVFTYQLTGTALYGAGLSSYHEKTAHDFWGGIGALEKQISEQGLGQTARDVVMAPIERFERGIEAGDAFEAGAGLGNLTLEAAVLAEGAGGIPRVSVSMQPARALAFAETGAGTLLPGGLSIAVTGGSGAPLAVPGFLASQATSVKENTPTQQNPFPTKLVKAKGNSTPKAPTARPKKRSRGRQVKEDSIAREKATEARLREQYPDADVQGEHYLRDSSGRIVRDPETGTARRIDHAVIKDGEVIDLVETTSKTAPKAEQLAKEARIRSEGADYVRRRNPRQVTPIREGVRTRLQRND